MTVIYWSDLLNATENRFIATASSWSINNTFAISNSIFLTKHVLAGDSDLQWRFQDSNNGSADSELLRRLLPFIHTIQDNVPLHNAWAYPAQSARARAPLLCVPHFKRNSTYNLQTLEVMYKNFAHFMCFRRWSLSVHPKTQQKCLSVSFGSLEICRFYVMTWLCFLQKAKAKLISGKVCIFAFVCLYTYTLHCAPLGKSWLRLR